MDERPEPGQGHGPRRWVQVRDIMGTAVSIHVLAEDPSPAGTGAAVERAFDRLRRADRVFSPFREDSDIRRIARGDLAPADADPDVLEMVDRCLQARRSTAGLFDAWRSGWFDPTGLVKGWAVEEAARRDLAPLVEDPRVTAVGIAAGGDMQLLTDPASSWVWNVGIADPFHTGRLIARIPVTSGAVATSGPAERGAHISDPRTGEPASGVASATVVADSLTTADLWATTAVVAGLEDLAWVRGAGTTSGLLVSSDGRTRRWAGSRVLDLAGDRSAPSGSAGSRGVERWCVGG